MSNPLRVVTFNNLPQAFQITQGWAAQAGHKVVLAVTSPGPKTRRSMGYRQIAAMAGDQNIELLVTTRLKTVVIPILRALQPDLIVSFSFPWLLPAELLATARFGAVNLHPALLPAYRGPNPLRQFYDAAPVIGATLHWTEGEFDTGRILSQHRAAMPRPATSEAIFAAWGPTMMMALAGDPGEAQPEVGVSYAAEFTEADYWLDIQSPAHTLQCQMVALAFTGAYPIRIRIANQIWQLERVDLVEDRSSSAPPGSIVEQASAGVLVQTGAGLAKLIGQVVP
jgi:methionyl-tRNA formyltransferase